MTTYNTGNPVPSADARDRFDNSQTFDEVVTGTAPTAMTRLGRPIKTLAGQQSDFDSFLTRTAFELPPLVYVDGAPLQVDRSTQLVQRSGLLYSVKLPQAFPYTLTGTWATDQPFLTVRNDQSLRQDLGSNAEGQGADLCSWVRRPLASAITTVGQMLDGQAVNLWEFANYVTDKPDPVDPDTWDWTPAWSAAAVSVPTGVNPYPETGRLALVIPSGVFHLTAVEHAPKVDIYGAGCVVKPFDPDAVQTHLLKFTGFSRVYNLTIDMEYAMNYDAAVWVRGRYNQFYGVNTWKGRYVWMFGDKAWATDPASGALGDSENILTACETNWCITAVRAYGQNTILHFNDCLIYSYKDTLPSGDPRKAAWDALEEITFQNWGGLIYINGGCIANYTGVVPTLRAELQPVPDDPAYFNAFGKYYLDNTHVESGWLFECGPVGAYTATDERTRVLTARGCNGFLATSAAPFISIGGDCQQSVHVSACNFYGGVGSTIAYGLGGKVHIDSDSFSGLTNFFQSMVVRRPQGYDNFCATRATGSTQAFSPSLQTLKMPTLAESDVASGLASLWYEPSTGVFTAQTDMRDVEVAVQILMASGASADMSNLQLILNGSQQVDLGASYGAAPRVTLYAPRLSRGETLEVRVSSSASRTAQGGASTFMAIKGSV